MPHLPQDLLDRISALEREVRQLRGRTHIRPALSQILAGDVIIGQGGQLIAKEPGGQIVFAVGQSAAGDWVTQVGRIDGTVAFSVGDDVGTAGQMVRVWSRDTAAPDRVLVSDDAHSGRYLGRPSMPIPMQSTAGQTTTSTTLATAWTGASRVINAVLYASFETYTPNGVTAAIQLEDSTGVVDSWTASRAGGGWTLREITRPVRHPFMSHVNYRLRHRISAGTGSIQTNCLGVYTRNTHSASEAPT